MLASTAQPSPLAPQVLAVQGLTYRYGDRLALSDLEFDVRRGEILGLLGPNGAGKSTLFGLLTGLSRPQAGRILLDGEPLSPEDGLFRASLGVVFQRPSLDGKLTARENLELAAQLFGVPRGERRSRAIELLAWMELSERERERVETFSEGMKRRLELARALVHRPRLLVMDEPTQGLDEGAFQKTWARLRELKRREGLAVVLATHRADEAEQCDRLAVLHRGVRIALNTPEALRASAGGDRVVIEADDAGALGPILSERFGVEPRVAGHTLVFEASRAHELVPRLVEALPAGRVRAISVRRPTLADAFLRLTGTALEDDRRASPVGQAYREEASA
ncbi:MAG: ABC transporter ATP-binding protein [Myxococcales bacterium]